LAAIALDKTWVVNYFYNPSVVTAADNARTTVVQVKDAMKANGWAVASSSDGTTPGTGAADYWTDYTKIVCGTGDHSWIVLTNSHISANFSVCIEFKHATYTNANFYCCTGGYNVDGTKSVRPTVLAGTEVTLCTTTTTWVDPADANYFNAAVYSSTDGECTRVYFGTSNAYITWCTAWIFDKPKNPPSWFTTPYIACVSYQCPLLYTYWCETGVSTGMVKTNIGATQINLKFGSLGLTGALGNLVGHRGQDYGGSFIFSPAYLCSITAAAPGIYGEMYDLYWTTGSFCYREDGTTTGVAKFPGCLPSAARASGFQLMWQMAQGNDGVGRGLI